LGVVALSEGIDRNAGKLCSELARKKGFAGITPERMRKVQDLKLETPLSARVITTASGMQQLKKSTHSLTRTQTRFCWCRGPKSEEKAGGQPAF
jgi:hypothetical protein